MSVTVKIPPILKDITHGQDTIEVTGATFEQVLNNLEIQFPGLKAQLYDKRGNLISIYEIYINGESAYPNELNKSLSDGDEVSIAMLYVGG